MGGQPSKHSEHSDDLTQPTSLFVRQPSISIKSTEVNEKDALSKLPDSVIVYISEYLTPEDEARLIVAKPVMNGSKRDALRARGIRPPLTSFFFTPPQRTANYLVLTGRPAYLLKMLQKDPSIFFKTYQQITDAAGQTFYNASPADLISFICDDDMQMQVNDFAEALPSEQRKNFFKQWQIQHASRGLGGADLVLLTGDNPPDYARIGGVTHTFNVYIATKTIQSILLKNPDGVICWRDPNNQLHWYYANHDKETLEKIDICLESQAAHQVAYEAFVTRMQNMQPYTARRSSNEEHALIQAIMRHQESKQPIHLVRQGIHYRQDGIDFVDTHYDFNRIVNAYLKCMSLYKNGNDAEGDSVWRRELGHVQREVMWLVQRYCEKNRSFWPLADNYKHTPFVRSFEIYHFYTDKQERIFNTSTGAFIYGFGLDDDDSGFAIYKTKRMLSAVACAFGDELCAGLVAMNRFSVDATQQIESMALS